MRPAQAPAPEILDSLFNVFREHGFEGASLSDLSKATGLGRSSLYHYFPEGKEQMAQAVLSRARSIIESEVKAIANGPGSLKTRVRKIVAALDQIYGGGRTGCLLGRMATSPIGNAAREDLQLAFAYWIEAIEKLAAESGQSAGDARDFAQDWVARLQGALLLQAANGELGPYNRAMDALQDLASAKPKP